MDRSNVTRFRPSEKLIANARHGFKVALAAVLSFLITTVLEMPQPYWSVISAVVVMQTNLGGTVIAAQERSLGTVVGAIVGGIAAYFQPSSLIATVFAMSTCIGLLAFAAAGRPSLRVAPITAVLLIGATAHVDGGMRLALERVIEIFLGCAVGVVVTMLVFPVHWNRDLVNQARDVARQLAISLSTLPSLHHDASVLNSLFIIQSEVRRRLAIVEKTVADAERAPGGRTLAEKGSSITRALWRVRNDVVSVTRAFEAARAESRGSAIIDSAKHVMAAASNFLNALGTEPVAMDDPTKALDDASTQLDISLEKLRSDPTAAPQDFAAIIPIVGLVFTLHTLTRNLKGLADRFREIG